MINFLWAFLISAWGAPAWQPKTHFVIFSIDTLYADSIYSKVLKTPRLRVDTIISDGGDTIVVTSYTKFDSTVWFLDGITCTIAGGVYSGKFLLDDSSTGYRKAIYAHAVNKGSGSVDGVHSTSDGRGGTGTAAALYGEAFGDSGPAIGVEGVGQGHGTKSSYGGWFYGNRWTGSGESYGVYGKSDLRYGGFFTAFQYALACSTLVDSIAFWMKQGNALLNGNAYQGAVDPDSLFMTKKYIDDQIAVPDSGYADSSGYADTAGYALNVTFLDVGWGLAWFDVADSLKADTTELKDHFYTETETREVIHDSTDTGREDAKGYASDTVQAHLPEIRETTIVVGGVKWNITYAESALYSITADSLGGISGLQFVRSDKSDTGTGDYLFTGTITNSLVDADKSQALKVYHDDSSASIRYGLNVYCKNRGAGEIQSGYFVASAEGTGVHTALYGWGLADNIQAAHGIQACGENVSSGQAIGGYFWSCNAGSGIHYGVRGFGDANSNQNAYGVYGQGRNVGSGNVYGGYFLGSADGTGTHYGVYTESDSFALYCSTSASSGNYASYHAGNVYVTGDLIGNSDTFNVLRREMPDSALEVWKDSATVVLRKDGSVALTGNWAAGDFDITGLNKASGDSANFTVYAGLSDFQIGTGTGASDDSITVVSPTWSITSAGDIVVGGDLTMREDKKIIYDGYGDAIEFNNGYLYFHKKLYVKNKDIQIAYSGSPAFRVDDANSVNTIFNIDATTNGDVYITPKGTGNVGIGTNTPKRQFDFDGADVRTQRQLDTDLNTNLGYGTFGAGNLAHTTGNDGWYNNAFGINALYNVTTGNSNMGFGSYTLYENTTGTGNVAIGASTVRSNTTGNYNTGIGRLALYTNTTGDYNVGIGYYSLRYVNPTVSGEGEGNIGIGYNAGDNITTGSYNIAIGYDVEVSSATEDYQLNIGNTIYGDMSTGIVTATGFAGDLNGTINTATTAVTQSPGDNSTKLATTAYASSKGINVFELYSESDLPTPSAGVSTLSSGKYVMKDAFSLSTIEEFQCDADAVIEWTSEDKENHILTHTTASKTLFNFTGGSRFKIEHASFILTGNNAKFTNMTGTDFNSKFNDFRVIFTGTGGTVADILNTEPGTNEFVDGTIAGFQDGITMTNSAGVQILGILLASDETGTDALISIKNMSAIAINLNNNVFIGGASQSNFYIDPVVEVPVQIFSSNTAGSTTFFKSGTTGTFTAVADASVGATAITSVTNSSGIARFNFTVGPTLYVNQEVVISTFVTNTAYNGTYIITATGSGYFEIASIPFGSDETGSFLSNSIIITDIATTLSDGNSVLLNTTLSTDYDKGSFVYNKQTNSVQLNMTWTATKSGTWDTGSLTEDSKYINAGNNGAQESSFNISSVFTSGNTSTTSITGLGTFDPLNLGTASEGQSNSRFKMLNDSTGLVEYTGLNDFNGKIITSISASKIGPMADYKFRAFKVVGSPAFDPITITKDIDSITKSIIFVTSAKLSPGDQFRIEVEAQSGTTVITVSDFSMLAD